MDASQNIEYLGVDERWEIFGTNSLEEHIQKNVVRGVFEKNVPKDIVDDYKTIEYQQVYSYYHWPLLDEALNKGLRLLEMAIKLKAKESGIALKSYAVKPKEKRFSQLIDEVCKEEPLLQLKETIHHLRNIRNFTIHKEANSYFGGLGGLVRRNLQRLVNLINDLFQDPEVLKFNLLSEKAESLLFVDTYLGTLTISPPLIKEDFKNEALWAFEEMKYKRMLKLASERVKNKN